MNDENHTFLNEVDDFTLYVNPVDSANVLYETNSTAATKIARKTDRDAVHEVAMVDDVVVDVHVGCGWMDGAGAAISHHFPPLLARSVGRRTSSLSVVCAPPASSRGDHFPSRHFYTPLFRLFLPPFQFCTIRARVLHPVSYRILPFQTTYINCLDLFLLSRSALFVAYPYDFHVTLTKLQTINERY